ncbi:iron chaperone [Hyphobacterium sp.]|uniref:iron chaperone n=1 Tax=Hyphobacterium sp. TaxID=2004662 RepID=UPI003BA9799E
MVKFKDHEAYISAAAEPLRPLLVRLRADLAKALPDTDEIIAYDMPGFAVGQKIIAGFAAFSKQCGLYVAPGAITENADAIKAAGLKATKTGVTFSPKKPIPSELVRSLALAARKELGV